MVCCFLSIYKLILILVLTALCWRCESISSTSCLCADANEMVRLHLKALLPTINYKRND